MINEYGKYRLDFDFRKHEQIGTVFSEGFLNCEYVSDEDLLDYAYEYTEELLQRYELAKENKAWVVDYIMIVNDLICKIFTVKKKKWEKEKEWRKTVLLDESKSDIFFDSNNRPYKKVYFPRRTLKSVVIFKEKEEWILYTFFDWLRIRLFLFRKNYFRVPVRIVEYERM